jgi:protein involved in sex pheromone biosynthesis
MKKYISLVLISTTLILSSCSIDWTGENEKKIIELEKQAQNDIFKKKQECANYTEEIKNAIQI